MKIERINSLKDERFREKILKQHGAFLADGEPCGVEITGERTATVFSERKVDIDALIGEFRFFAEHITTFYDADGRLLRQFEPVKLFDVKIDDIQPSQFYVSAEKLNAVGTFIQTGWDVIVPLNADGDRYISLDGHTRLYLAAQMGTDRVRGFIAESSDCVRDFAREAQKRGIFSPRQMQVLQANEYEIKWNRFCDEYFAAKGKDG